MGPEKPRLERVMWRKMRLKKQIPKKWLMRLKLRLERILKKPRLQRVMIIMIGDEDNWFEDKNENKDCGIMPLLLGQRQLLSSIPRQ